MIDEKVEKIPPLFLDEPIIKKETRGRKPNSEKKEKSNTNLSGDLISYSEAFASLVDDNKFALEKNESVSLSLALNNLAIDFDFNINSRLSSFLSLILVISSISLRRKESIVNLIKKMKNAKKSEKTKSDI